MILNKYQIDEDGKRSLLATEFSTHYLKSQIINLSIFLFGWFFFSENFIKDEEKI